MSRAYPTVRLRYLAQFNPPVPGKVASKSETEWPLLPMEDIGNFTPPTITQQRPYQALSTGYSYLEPTDVAYAKVTPCFENGKGLSGVDLQGPTFATTEVSVLRPRPAALQRFLAYVVQSEDFRSAAIASMTGAGGLRRVSEAEMKNFPMPAPDTKRQSQIADYLDHETAEIDNFIADSNQLQNLAHERASAAADALIWSVNQDMVPLRRVLRHVDQGSSPSVEAVPAGVGEIGILKSGCTNNGQFDLEANKRVPAEMSIPHEYFISPGDVIMSRASGSERHVGSVALVPDLDRQLALSDKNYRLHFENAANAVFMVAAMNTQHFRHKLQPLISGASGLAKNISVTSLKSIVVPLPELPAQIQLGQQWINLRAASDALHKDLGDAVALARERRAALITAAVTGQIDVTAKNKPAAEQLEDDIAQGLHREN